MQRAVVASLNSRFEAEEADGTAPPGTSPEGFRLLHGCELEVRADATLDYPDEVLARYDLVVASVHVSRRQSRRQLTDRTLAAIHNPNVDIIAHPAGRYIGSRDDLDLDWDAVFTEAARTGTALELNGSDERLDLSDVRARRAAEFGCTFAIDSDAHRIEELDNLRWGTAMARRAWLTADVVINTRSRADLLEWAAGAGDRGRAVAHRHAQVAECFLGKDVGVGDDQHEVHPLPLRPDALPRGGHCGERGLDDRLEIDGVGERVRGAVRCCRGRRLPAPQECAGQRGASHSGCEAGRQESAAVEGHGDGSGKARSQPGNPIHHPLRRWPPPVVLPRVAPTGLCKR